MLNFIQTPTDQHRILLSSHGRPVFVRRAADLQPLALGKGVSSVTYPRYVVFDDAPQHRGFASTADQFADALRSPLAAIGVRVVRQHGAGANSPKAGFQAHGWSR